MKWFGRDWGAPACTPADHVATPVGELCLRCERPIGPADFGFVVPCLSTDGAHLAPYHLECMVAAFTPCPGCDSCTVRVKDS